MPGWSQEKKPPIKARGGEKVTHSFDVDIAVKYGVNAAVLLNNIYFWCQKNMANKHNYFDGSYWTYNSRNAFTTIFPYLSERQVKTALDKLIEDGVIKTGCYNKDGRDRSLWYAMTEKGVCMVQKSQMQMSKMSNANSENVRPLPDIETSDNKPVYKPDKSISRKRDKSVCSPGFDEFWKAYPRHVAKANAVKAWAKTGADDSQALTDSIIADVKQRLDGEWRGKDMQYIPHPATYLNQRRWEDETGVKKVAEHPRSDEPVILTPEEEAEIARIYAQNGRDAFM